MKLKLIVVAVVLLVVGVISSLASHRGLPVEAARLRTGSIQEFVEERAKTRLPRVYQITMPYDARIGAIELLEGTRVEQGQVLAQVVPMDLELAGRAVLAAVERLNATIAENDDTSLEKTSLERAVKTVESTAHTVEAARARAESAKAKLELATRNLSRVRGLRANNAKTEEELEKSQLEQVDAAMQYQHDLLQLRSLEAGKAASELEPESIRHTIKRKDLTHKVLAKQLEEAQVRFEQAVVDAKRGVLTSPVDGVVLERHVADEKRTLGGTVLLTVGRLEDLEIEADILSQEVVAVQPDDPVEITGPAIGPTPAKGIVRRIYPSGFMKISSLGVEQQRVRVIVGFDSHDLERLRRERGIGPEYRVRVRIITNQKAETLTVPRSAVFRAADGSWQVFAINGERRDWLWGTWTFLPNVEKRAIEPGLMNDERIEVMKGLDAGDSVVLAPETNLVPGSRVIPNFREVFEVKPPASRDD